METRYDLSPRDAGAILGVHEDTVKRWAADGRLKGYRTPGGWWKFSTDDVRAFVDHRAPRTAS